MDGGRSCLDKQVIKLHFKCDVNLTTTTTTVFTACNHIRNLAAGLQSIPEPQLLWRMKGDGEGNLFYGQANTLFMFVLRV